MYTEAIRKIDAPLPNRAGASINERASHAGRAGYWAFAFNGRIYVLAAGSPKYIETPFTSEHSTGAAR